MFSSFFIFYFFFSFFVSLIKDIINTGKEEFLELVLEWSRLENQDIAAARERLHERASSLGLVENPEIDTEGDCQFDAFADQLFRIGRPQTSKERVRRDIVDWIVRSADFELGNGKLKDYIEATSEGVSFDAYIEKMSRERTYGDEVTLFAMMELFKVGVMLVSSTCEVDKWKIVQYPKGYSEKDGLPLLKIAIELDHHYWSLIPLPEAVSQRTRSKQGPAKKSKKVSDIKDIWKKVAEEHGAVGLLRLNMLPLCLDFEQNDPLNEFHQDLRTKIGKILSPSLVDPLEMIVCGLLPLDEENDNPSTLWIKTKGDSTSDILGESEAESVSELLDALCEIEDLSLAARIWTYPFSGLPHLFDGNNEEFYVLRKEVGEIACKVAEEMMKKSWFLEQGEHVMRWKDALKVLYLNKRTRLGLQIPGGATAFTIVVSGFSRDDTNVLRVKVSKKGSTTVVSGLLSMDVLSKGKLLGKWVSKLLGEPFSCSYTELKAVDLLNEAAEQARVAQAKEKALHLFGFQRDSRQFVFSSSIAWDMSSAQIVDPCAVFNEELLKLDYLPHRLLQEKRLSEEEGNGIRPWIDLWTNHFGDEHLAELFFVLGHISMCMLQSSGKSILLIHGRADSGKTELMKFVALMLGFKPGALYLSGKVTDFALHDRLHFLSGLPTFLNDPTSKEELNVIQKIVKNVFDASSLGESRGRHRDANGFLCLTVNDNALKMLLSEKEEFFSRFVILPVGRCKNVKSSLVDDLIARGDVLPSSAAVYRELLKPKAMARIVIDLLQKLFLKAFNIHRRVKNSLWSISTRTSTLANMAGVDIDSIMEGSVAKTAQKFQPHTNLQEEQAYNFLRSIYKNYFSEETGKLKDGKGIVFPQRNGNYFINIKNMNVKDKMGILAGLKDIGLGTNGRRDKVRGWSVSIDPSNWPMPTGLTKLPNTRLNVTANRKKKSSNKKK